ncbi:MAG: NAD-dependent deacetylase hst3 [Ramalina farinacea]|uniref:NAD-dependent deacetylase hst3 n=1 Tax=Ramalina farinacea TaxID=258253 RepID=A0AA43QVC2_9LECA|nr:NAD-dependent deacetylase hst3 [Ramalina farinacea]
MVITEVNQHSHRELHSIADAIASARKIVVVTGAGISTNCGIPVSTSLCAHKTQTELAQDFRSEQGLYSLIQSQRDKAQPHTAPTRTSPRKHAAPPLLLPTLTKTKAKDPTNTKGKDMFDSMIWKDKTSTSVFYNFIASLRQTIQEDIKKSSATHSFIRTLRDRRRLVRCYTQNIDGLEERQGLSTDISNGKGARSRFSKKAMERPTNLVRSSSATNLDHGCEVVQLHGDLKRLRCTLCQQTLYWDQAHTRPLMAGKAPTCPSCAQVDQSRQDRGKRGTSIGILRPNIVLYGEEHPSAEMIGDIVSYDLATSPDLLLILGTSLHVHGLKTMVREFARSVHSRAKGRGKVVFVNLSKPADSAWKDVIDDWVCMDCDEWVAKVRQCRPDIWQIQESLDLKLTKKVAAKAVTPKISSKCAIPDSDDEENLSGLEQARPPFNSPKPKVVIITPQQTRSPLQECAAQSRMPLTARKLFATTPQKGQSRTIPDSDPFSSLPTPPSSRSSSHGCMVTPSKRRRLADDFDVWED